VTAVLQRWVPKEFLIPLAAIMAILMLVIPMPPIILDFFLLANIAMAIGILVLTLSIQSPLELGSFPTLLLLATLFRLALEVTATRLILTRGFAGAVIATFGKLVVGGNLVVGLVIFTILVLIQFLVITKGAERVSEVAARFTLDAMPGKQLAIDQAMNAGHLSEADARQRRSDVEAEADFYGAMDGASKFVRGDAIAGLLIVIINLIGGLLIGLVERHLAIGKAAHTYSILTVGEGLTTQIPALLLSTATGFLVTRSGAREGAAAHALLEQLTAMPRVFYLIALVLFMLAILGIPPLYPLVLGSLAAGTGWLLDRRVQQRATAVATAQATQAPPPVSATATALAKINVTRLQIEVSASLIPIVSGDAGRVLSDQIQGLRSRIAAEQGFVVPTIDVRDLRDLGWNAYRIRLRGGVVASGQLYPEHLLAMGGDLTGITQSIAVKDPVFGQDAAWIPGSAKGRAEMAGATVISAATVLLTHLGEVIRTHAAELLTREATRQLVDHVRDSHPTVVNELLPDVLSIGEIQQVLQHLLHERVSIRDLPTILEALGDRARTSRTIVDLTEAARQALSRMIVEPYLSRDNGHLQVIVLAPTTEQWLGQHRVITDAGPILSIPPSVAQTLLAQLRTAASKAPPQSTPVLLTADVLRWALHRQVERSLPHMPVLSYSEYPPDLAMHTLAQITLPNLAGVEEALA